MDADEDPTSGGPAADVCANCGERLYGPFCAACGQRDADLRRPLREMLGEWLGAVVAFDSRMARTFPPLVLKPGFLTEEFLAGRRVRYVHPLKLYLAVSLVFFIGLAMAGYSFIRVGERDDAHVVALNFDRPEEEAPAPPAQGAGEEPSAESGGAASSSGATTGSELADSDGLPVWLAWLGDIAELHEEDPGQLDRLFIDRLAKSVFLLVPVFALLLKPLFRRRRLHYVEHLVFSAHLHSFAFVALLAGMAVNAILRDPQGAGGPVAQVVVLVYTFLALRRVYGDGRLRTAAKMAVLAFAYLPALILTMLITLFLTWLTI
jgi:hypothetical protein